MDWLEIDGKVVIVTGGSSGIGASIVKELCQLGAKVINADLREGTFGHENLLFYPTDVCLRSSIKELIQFTLATHKRIDGLVNNAGINMPQLLVDEKEQNSKFEINDQVFEKIVGINQKGVYLMSQAVGHVMVNQKSGIIINMSSECGLEGSEGQSIYAASKAAVNSYTRSWAKELGKKGIRVVGIAPGIMEETGLRTYEYESALAYTRGQTVEEIRAGYSQLGAIPLGRSGKLNEVANLVAYFLSDRSSYIAGVTVNIAGGKTRG